MKQRIQGIVIGLLIAVTLSCSTANAETGTQDIVVTYSNITLIIDGAVVTPKDVNGNIVEPFIYNGTTYLPVRAVGEAFGKPVDWEGSTTSVYVGERPNKPAREVPLYNKPYLDVTSLDWFRASGNDRESTIWLIPTGSGTWRSWTTHVTYAINSAARAFKGTLNPPPESLNAQMIYRLYGDNELIYTSPPMTKNVSPIPIEVDTRGYLQLKIELETTNVTRTFYFDGSYAGITNAVIVTTDY